MMPGSRLGVYYLEYGAAPRPIRVLYDRRGSAFTQLTNDQVDWTPVREAGVVHLTGITPALGPASRALAERALTEASAICFDLNYRAALWPPPEARAFALAALSRARYVFAGLEEARTVFGLAGPPEDVLEALAKHAPKATVSLLMGAKGSLTLDHGRTVRPRYPIQVEVVDPVGAGDAFVAGFLWATLRRRDIQEVVDTAAAVASLKCSIWGDIAAISPEDVDDVLAGRSGLQR
jgi:2-dehydro-3-deoxygluconokinase